ncbi:MAG TPA: PIN domain-containing protein [Fimbriimonadaceae bacterium]|nr:PIN domain-containing protein [Fimbriimonadaceae bacterium]
MDACVLAEAAVSDLLLRLADEPRLLLPRWSDSIWEETRRTWIERLELPESVAESRIRAAQTAFPEADVTGFESLIDRCANHPEDRHVLAAAIHARADAIVTFNVKDFPAVALDPWGVEAVHPSALLLLLYDLDPGVVTNVLHAMAGKAKRTMPEMLGRLAWCVEPFIKHIAAEQAIEIPDVPPRDWRRAP